MASGVFVGRGKRRPVVFDAWFWGRRLLVGIRRRLSWSVGVVGFRWRRWCWWLRRPRGGGVLASGGGLFRRLCGGVDELFLSVFRGRVLTVELFEKSFLKGNVASLIYV